MTPQEEKELADLEAEAAGTPSPEPVAAAPRPKKSSPNEGLVSRIVGSLGDAGRGLAQGATLGLGDEANGAVRAMWDTEDGDKRSFMDRYKQYRDVERQENEASKKNSPVLYNSGAIAGGVPAAVATGGGLATAAGTGAVAGLGASKAELTDPTNLDEVARATGDTLVGGALGAGAYGVGKAVSGIGSKLIGKAESATADVLAEQEANKAAADAAASGEMGPKYAEFNKNILRLRDEAERGSQWAKDNLAALGRDPVKKRLIQRLDAEMANQPAAFVPPERAHVEGMNTRVDRALGHPVMDAAGKGMDVAKKFGMHAIEAIAGKDTLKSATKMPQSTTIWLTKMLGENAERLGKYATPLAQAAARGPGAMAIADYLMSQKDQEYRAQRQQWLDEAARDADSINPDHGNEPTR